MQYKSTWHLMHLVLSFLTSGFWIPIWIYVTLANADHNKRVLFEQQATKSPPCDGRAR